MGDVLGSLKPAPIWKHFEKICTFPRMSKKEEKFAAYVRDFGKSCGLESTIDNAGNVIIKKPATKGMENCRTVVLQSHLDMVAQKNQDVKHDFEKDPILPRIEGDIVKATGTTLGADNGIGIATTLAVLESKDLVHGPIEALFTIDEEAGMGGVGELKPGLLKGDILFNLDNEEEGELCVSCAGGTDAIVKFQYKEEAPAKNSTAFKVGVAGLKGGHSGVDIQLGRANANKILDRLLWEARKDVDLRVAKWEGGDLRNAIPRWANAVVTVPADKADTFLRKVESVTAMLKKQYRDVDPDLAVKTEKTETPATTMDNSGTDRLLSSLYACPHGAFAMIEGMPTVAETSTNLAIVKVEKGTANVHNMVRSAVQSKRTDVANMIRALFELVGGETEIGSGYPGWEPNLKSPVLKMLKEVYATGAWSAVSSAPNTPPWTPSRSGRRSSSRIRRTSW
jgi:dipeptidase D